MPWQRAGRPRRHGRLLQPRHHGRDPARALQRPRGAETAEAAAATQVLSETGFREMFWPLTLPDWLPLPGKAAKRRALAFMRGLLRRHLDAPPRPGAQDLLTQLRALRDDETGEALSDQEVFDQCITTFQAGQRPRPPRCCGGPG